MSQTRFMVNFGLEEIRLYNTGTGVAGLGCSLINFLLTFIPISVTHQYIIYLVLVTILLFALIIININFLKNYTYTNEDFHNSIIKNTIPKEKGNQYTSLGEFEKKNKNKTTLGVKTPNLGTNTPNSNQLDAPSQRESIQTKVTGILDLNTQEETWKERLHAFKSVYVNCGLMFWTYVVTLGIFPVLCFQTGTGLAPEHNFAFVTVVYNIGDLFGKFFSYMIRVKDGCNFYMYGYFRGLTFATIFGLMVVFKDNIF